LIEKYAIDQKPPYNSNPNRDDCPAEYFDNDSPTRRVAVIMTVLNTLRQNRKHEKLIILGGSEGAVIANLLAAQLD